MSGQVRGLMAQARRLLRRLVLAVVKPDAKRVALAKRAEVRALQDRGYSRLAAQRVVARRYRDGGR